MKYLAFSMMNVQDRQYLHPGQGSYSVWNKEASCRESFNHGTEWKTWDPSAFYLKGAGRNSSRVRLNV